MNNADYTLYYEWAKSNIDVKSVIEHYLKNHEVIKNYLTYIQKEDVAKNSLICHLVNENVDSKDIEDIMFRYAGAIQNIYFEIGLKVGSKVGAEYLLKNNN